ncbi:MAG: DUF3667 domain-containing protein, partial [Armatimonadetes bacterium]|nr:DUF3667 domain-containing protein [Armatimonadota bacterium]
MRLSLFAKQVADPHPPNCLNCGAAVPPADRFCGKCGQENETSPVSFAALMREVWESFVQIDATLLRTLRLLVFRPGFLSAEYVRGRRGAYLSPFKMYLAVSAVYFLLWGLIVPFDRLRDAQEEAVQIEAQLMKDAAKKDADAKKNTSTKTQRDDLPVVSSKQSKNTISIKSNKDAVEFFRDFRRKPLHFFGMTIPIAELPETVSRYREAQAEKPSAERDTPLKHYLTERLIRFTDDPADSARNLFGTALPLLLLIQLPLFAVWMRLIYFRQKRLYVEHLVFLLHTHTFFFLLTGLLLFISFGAKSLGVTAPAFP